MIDEENGGNVAVTPREEYLQEGLKRVAKALGIDTPWQLTRLDNDDKVTTLDLLVKHAEIVYRNSLEKPALEMRLETLEKSVRILKERAVEDWWFTPWATD